MSTGPCPLVAGGGLGDDPGMDATTVHACPGCGLRFATRNELFDHVAVEHATTTPDDIPRVRQARGLMMLPLDPSGPPGRALPAAIALAQDAGLALGVVAVPVPGLPDPSGYLAARQRDLVAADVVTVPPKVLPGRVDEAIASEAAAGGTSLLCMATRARGRLAEPLLGSVSEAVVRRSPVPVLLVGPGARRPPVRVRRVVAGVDGTSVAEGARRGATRLAARLDVPLELVQVADPTEPVHAAPPCETAAVRDLPGGTAVVLRDRDAARALVEWAGTDGDTVVVVGTHGRTGLDRLVLGSVASGVARHASAPVLVVPRGTELNLDATVETGT